MQTPNLSCRTPLFWRGVLDAAKLGIVDVASIVQTIEPARMLSFRDPHFSEIVLLS
jgi:hypothetical protein